MKFIQISYELFPAVSILIFVSFISGHLLFSSLKIALSSNTTYRVFVKSTFGILLLTTVQAIITTKGFTIQWGLVFIGIIWYQDYKKNKQDKSYNFKINREEFFSFLLLLFISLIVYTFQGSLFYNPPFNNVPHGDYSFYSTIIEGYKYYGIETKNTVINTLKDNYSPSMYHHTDLWVAYLFFNYFTSSSLEAILIGSYTLLCAILIIGLIGFTKHFTKNKLIIVLSGFFIFFSGIPILKIIPQIDTFVYGVGYNTKNIIIALIAIPSILMFINKNKHFFFPLVLLPIINIITLPAIFSTLIILAFGSLVYFKKNWLFSISKKIILTVITVLSVIVLFYFNCSQYFPNTPKELTLNEIVLGLKNEPLKPILILAGTLICVGILYLIPLSFLLILVKKRKNRVLLNPYQWQNTIFIMLIGFSGLLTWSFLNILKDSAQFFYLPFFTFLNIYILVILAKIDSFESLSLNKVARILAKSLIIITLFINYINIKQYNPFVNYYPINRYKSEKYLTKLKTILENETKPIKIAYIVDSNNFSNFWSSIPYHQADGYIKNILSGIKQISLSTLDVNTEIFYSQEKHTLEKEIIASSFYYYVDSLKKNNSFSSLTNAKLKFLRDNHIKYLICEKGVENLNQNEYFKVKSSIKDSQSDEIFYVLDTE